MANNINTQDFVNRKVQRINLANNIKKVIELNEGKKYIPYEDSKGIMHIGIGFNLEDKDNQRFLKDSLNLTINDLKKEGFKLNENQVTKLYNHSISKAYIDAKKYDPNFDSRPKNVKVALLDMSFNLGLTRLNKFKKMKKGLEENNYNTVVKEMKDSLWYDQVKSRGPRMLKVMSSEDNLNDLFNSL